LSKGGAKAPLPKVYSIHKVPYSKGTGALAPANNRNNQTIYSSKTHPVRK